MYQSSVYPDHIGHEMALKGEDNEYLFLQYQKCINQDEHQVCLGLISRKADSRNIPVVFQYVKSDIELANTFGCRFKVIYLNGNCLNRAEQDKGFSNKGYLYYRQQLKDKYSSLGQFCTNGAALLLSGQNDYAKQYQKDFGDCIKNTVRLYQLSLIANKVDV